MKKLVIILSILMCIGLACEKPLWSNHPTAHMVVRPDGQEAPIVNHDTIPHGRDILIDSRQSKNLYRKQIKYLCCQRTESTLAPNLIGVDTITYCTPGTYWIRLIGWNDDGAVDSTQIEFTIK